MIETTLSIERPVFPCARRSFRAARCSHRLRPRRALLDDERHVQLLVEELPAVAAVAVLAELLAVIAEQHDHEVVVDALRLESREQSAEARVEVVDLAVVVIEILQDRRDVARVLGARLGRCRTPSVACTARADRGSAGRGRTARRPLRSSSTFASPASVISSAAASRFSGEAVEALPETELGRDPRIRRDGRGLVSARSSRSPPS